MRMCPAGPEGGFQRPLPALVSSPASAARMRMCPAGPEGGFQRPLPALVLQRRSLGLYRLAQNGVNSALQPPIFTSKVILPGAVAHTCNPSTLGGRGCKVACYRHVRSHISATQPPQTHLA
ncbi:hypothetical protein AAY473_016353 [Plecturocebus cupreus]